MQVKRIYEAMFLVDANLAGKQEQLDEVIARLMQRAEADLLYCKKWDERRLAYEVDGRKRGVYFLSYFKAPTDSLDGFERDVRLADGLLRVLVLKCGLTEEKIKQMDEEPAVKPVRPARDNYGETQKPQVESDNKEEKEKEKEKVKVVTAAVADDAPPSPAESDREEQSSVETDKTTE